MARFAKALYVLRAGCGRRCIGGLQAGVGSGLEGSEAGAGLFGQTFVEAALFGGSFSQHALLRCLGGQHLCQLGFGRLLSLPAAGFA